MTPLLTQYKFSIEQYIQKISGYRINIQEMHAGWYWFEPVLKFHNIKVYNTNKKPLKIQQVIIGINMISSLVHLRIQPKLFYINSTHIIVQQVNNQWHIQGFIPSSNIELSNLLSMQYKIICKNIRIDLHPQNSKHLELKITNFTISHRGHVYAINLNMKQDRATSIQMMANLQAPFTSNINGEIYLSVKNFNVSKWQALFNYQPLLQKLVIKGLMNGEVWLFIENNMIKRVQSNIATVAMQFKFSHKKFNFNTLSGNFLWEKTIHGWQLTSDQMQCKINNILWPTNQIKIIKNQDTWQIYCKYLLLDSLRELSTLLQSTWPNLIESIAEYNVQGIIKNLQLEIENHKIKSVLAKIHQLNWQAVGKFPAVANLSGAIQWQPNFGRLVFRSPDLSLNVNYTLTDSQLDAQAQTIMLSAQGSIMHAEKWLKYLPLHSVKPKFYTWLNTNIKSIQKMIINADIRGKLDDLPFGKQKDLEKFIVDVYVDNMSLFFAPGWPLTRDIQTYIHFNKGDLVIQVPTANFCVAPLICKQNKIKQLNLTINNIGSDKEFLIVAADLQLLAQIGLNYIQNSPLKTSLQLLNILKINDLVDLKLDLQFPLYPENNQILVAGQVKLDHNTLNIHNNVLQMSLYDTTGTINFNHHGLSFSKITANFKKNANTIIPLNIVMHSEQHPNNQDNTVMFNITFAINNSIDVLINSAFTNIIHINIKKFQIHDWNLENLSIIIKQLSEQDWRIKIRQQDVIHANLNYHLDAEKHNNFDGIINNYMTLQGSWTYNKIKNFTSVKMHIIIKDLAKLFNSLVLAPIITAKYSDINFDSRWLGNVTDFAIEQNTGNINMLLKDGIITNLNRKTEEKIGIGKLLSILSLQTIPRRLKLDFSDLSNTGYAFDIFQGNLIINKGVLATENSYIDGPVAYATIHGDLDIIKKLYNVTLKISPHFTASLPIVATIAGGPIIGPIAGLATWAAMKIINQSMQKINSYTYKISGPWQQPLIQQINIEH